MSGIESRGIQSRGTQSVVHICVECWRRPELLLWEVLWRWLFGIPACGLVMFAAHRVLAGVSPGSVDGLSFNDPMQAAQQLLVIAEGLVAPAERTAFWLVPLLAVAWAIISGLGRRTVLRRLDPSLRSSPGPLMALQLLRITALSAAGVGWYLALHWVAQLTLTSEDPNLVGYAAGVICVTLGGFVVWALVGWVFSIAPLLAMLQGTGVLRSVAGSLRLGSLSAKLVEVNLVLGIVRLALVVLALVFSAIPLPFEEEMHGVALYLWWAAVTVLYLVASDFFQVVRLAAFVRFWQLDRSRG